MSTCALGIDIGTERTRVALVERRRGRALRLLAVAARPTGEDPAAAIRAARAELGARERRCVFAVGSRDALLQLVPFPPMTTAERQRAASFGAMRAASFPLHDVHVIDGGAPDARALVTAARRSTLETLRSTARRAGVRILAVDHAAFALVRAVEAGGAAIIDLGADGTRLALPAVPIPVVRTIALGGAAITAAIASALEIPRERAEERKRLVGTAGAGETARRALLEEIAAILVDLRAVTGDGPGQIVLSGNGARLPAFALDLAAATGTAVSCVRLRDDLETCGPADVMRSAAPDWALAVGLALWETAA